VAGFHELILKCAAITFLQVTSHHLIRSSRKIADHTSDTGTATFQISAAQPARTILCAAIYESRQNDMKDKPLRAKSSRQIFYCELLLAGARGNRTDRSRLSIREFDSPQARRSYSLRFVELGHSVD
jgi:hypothetical protein